MIPLIIISKAFGKFMFFYLYNCKHLRIRSPVFSNGVNTSTRVNNKSLNKPKSMVHA